MASSVPWSGTHARLHEKSTIQGGLYRVDGHNEVVQVVFDSKVVKYEELLKVFWENHDPTQGFRQGNEGTQYRSGIYWFSESQRISALSTQQSYQKKLTEYALGQITTEIKEAGDFYYAEDEHQQCSTRIPMDTAALAVWV